MNKAELFDHWLGEHKGIEVRKAHAAIEFVQNVGQRNPVLHDVFESGEFVHFSRLSAHGG